MKAPPQNNPSALPPQEELIDETVLDGLHRLHRKTRPLAKTVIMLSLQSAPAALEHLQQSAVKGDAGLLARASHNLSASSAAIGRLPLSARCKELGTIVDRLPMHEPLHRPVRCNPRNLHTVRRVTPPSGGNVV
jgi:hypothetical protein